MTSALSCCAGTGGWVRGASCLLSPIQGSLSPGAEAALGAEPMHKPAYGPQDRLPHPSLPRFLLCPPAPDGQPDAPGRGLGHPHPQGWGQGLSQRELCWDTGQQKAKRGPSQAVAATRRTSYARLSSPWRPRYLSENADAGRKQRGALALGLGPSDCEIAGVKPLESLDEFENTDYVACIPWGDHSRLLKSGIRRVPVWFSAEMCTNHFPKMKASAVSLRAPSPCCCVPACSWG